MDNDLILNFALFEGFSADEVGNLLKLAHVHPYPAGAMLFFEGDQAEEFSIILQGQVEIIKAMWTEEEKILAIMHPGDFLGEMSLLNPDQRRTASARALSETSLLEITKIEFETLLSHQPKFALRLMQEMSLRNRNLERAVIHDLQEKNRRLARAYQELEAAQAQLIEKERLESELALARKIQESNLIKELPQPSGWQIAARWQPARSVSGDFYDLILQPEHKLVVIMADASGKGMPAALVAATTRSILHTLAARVDSPGEVLASANELLFAETPPGVFVTCFYGILNLETGLFRYANAGQSWPFKLVFQGSQEIRAKGMPLGMLPGSNYEEAELQLNCGEKIFLFSDGLLEAHDAQGEMFGTQRILASLLAPQISEQSGDVVVDHLINALAVFNRGGEPEDDITCMIIGRN